MWKLGKYCFLKSTYQLFETGYRLDILKLLHEKGADIKATECLGNNALHLAVQKSNNTELIHYLVEQAKLDVNARNLENQTALHLATYYGYLQVAKYLVENGAKVSISSMFFEQLLRP